MACVLKFVVSVVGSIEIGSIALANWIFVTIDDAVGSVFLDDSLSPSVGGNNPGKVLPIRTIITRTTITMMEKTSPTFCLGLSSGDAKLGP